jgi:vancomycin resistance protein VanJ
MPAAAAPPRDRRWLRALVALSVAAALGAWALLRFAGDTWWPGTLLLFGPRWIAGAPIVALAPWALWRDRRLLIALGMAAAVVIVPVMGLEPRLPRGSTRPAAAEGERRLRLMTYNVGDSSPDPRPLVDVFRQINPDLFAIQECYGAGYAEALHQLGNGGYRIHAHGDECVVSRYPIEKIEFEDRADIERLHGTGGIMRYAVQAPWGEIHLVNVHLATVRQGLSSVLQKRLAGVPDLVENTRVRAAESALARRWVDATESPLLIAGDFNMPIESAIYRRDWASFPNAFSIAGSGFGTSKATRWFGVRIDHILLGQGWEVDQVFVGPHIDGDHRPVIADLRFTGPAAAPSAAPVR